MDKKPVKIRILIPKSLSKNKKTQCQQIWFRREEMSVRHTVINSQLL